MKPKLRFFEDYKQICELCGGSLDLKERKHRVSGDSRTGVMCRVADRVFCTKTVRRLARVSEDRSISGLGNM